MHLFPEEAVIAYLDLKAKKYFPFHWGMFQLKLSVWYHPITTLFKKHLEGKINLIVAKPGELIRANDDYKLINWWTKLIKSSKK